MSNDPILLILRHMIETRQLTNVTTAMYMGERLVPDGEGDIDPTDKIEWADDGFSVERSEVNGRMCRKVEQFRAHLLKGNEQQQQAASDLPQYFCRASDLPGPTDRATYQARENIGSAFGWGLGGFSMRRVEPMRVYSPRYFVKGTKEPEWRYPPAWESVDLGRATPGDWIPNHRVCTGGEWTPEDLLEWSQTFALPAPAPWTPPSGG